MPASANLYVDVKELAIYNCVLRICQNMLYEKSKRRMEKLFTATTLSLAIICGADNPAHARGDETYGDLEAQYETCYDGDTCRFDIPGVHPSIGEDMPVRLYGVDTPEIRGKCEREKVLAKIVRDYVRGVLKEAKKIELRNIQRGKYFRFVARINADGVDLTEDLIEKGYGGRYDGGKKENIWCVGE